MDRDFCVSDFLYGIDTRQAFFICRQHQELPWVEESEERFVGRGESGATYEQWVTVTDSEGHSRKYCRIRIVLKKATRDGDKELCILANLSKITALAKLVAQIYCKRWTIETVFQELEAHLHSKINSLGFPKSRSIRILCCVALVAYNVLAVVKAALRNVHGENQITTEVSDYYIVGHLERTYDGMMIAVPEEKWKNFQEMRIETFSSTLLQLANKVNLAKFKKHKRGPKQPKSNQRLSFSQPHVSTAKLIKGVSP